MTTRRAMVLAAMVWLEVGGAAQAQGNGPGFHAAVFFDGACSAAFNQIVSLPTPPATAGPTTASCLNGTSVAAGEAAATGLRASTHQGGAGSRSIGRARIQIENVVIVGPAAATIPVSLNFRMRGSLASQLDFGNAGVSLYIALGGGLQSTSLIDMDNSGYLNKTGIFAPLALGFPSATIDQQFATPVGIAVPNQPLRLDLELMTYSGMPGVRPTHSDFFTGNSGVALPFGIPVLNLPPGYTVNIPELSVINNFVALPATVPGDVVIGGTNASEISAGTLTHVTGSVNVSGNVSATGIDLGALEVVGGVVDVTGNTSAIGIDLGALTTVGDDLIVEDNSACTHVILGPLTAIAGNLIIESCGSGLFSLGSAIVGGNTTLNASGYSAVDGMTAAGVTAISNATADARVTVHLPARSFATPTTFSLTRLDPQTLVPETGSTPDGSGTVDPIAAYQITFGVPALNANATLTFDVYLAGLDATTAGALLDALTSGDATLVTRGDAIGSEYQAFAVCGGAVTPTPGGCVQVQLLDANEQPTTSSPAIVRFTGVVGHFSTWGVALVTSATSEAFAFDGLLPPYPAPPYDETPTFQRGRVIPLKFAWTDAAGAHVDSASAAPSVSVYPLNCASLAPSSEPITPDDAGASGGLRYDADAATWIYNWSTRPLAAGCYAIRVTSSSPAFAAPAASFPVALRSK